MEYRIVEKPAFFFAGVSKRVPMQFEGVNQEIVKLASDIGHLGSLQQLFVCFRKTPVFNVFV